MAKTRKTRTKSGAHAGAGSDLVGGRKRGDLAIVTTCFYDDQNADTGLLDNMLCSADFFGHKVHVFRGSDNYGNKSCSNSREFKVTRLLPELEKIRSKWVMWVDATDTIFMRDPMIAVDLLERSGKRMLFSSERNCFPDKRLEEHFKSRAISARSNTDSIYINAGVFVGYRKDVIEHLKCIDSIPKPIDYKYDLRSDDQWLWHKMFIYQDSFGASIAIDYGCEMSLSTVMNAPFDVDGASDGRVKCIKMKCNGAMPVVLHLNGSDKCNGKKIRKILESVRAVDGGVIQGSLDDLYNNCFFSYSNFYALISGYYGSASRLVELVPWAGYSTMALSRAIGKAGGRSMLDCIECHGSVAGAEWSPSLVKLRQMRAKRCSGIISGFSSVAGCPIESAGRYGDCSVDFMFIDLRHLEHDLGKIIEGWTSKISDGGIIAGCGYGTDDKITSTVNRCFGGNLHTHAGGVWFKIKGKLK
jgi:hypothetical protein